MTSYDAYELQLPKLPVNFLRYEFWLSNRQARADGESDEEDEKKQETSRECLMSCHCLLSVHKEEREL